MDNKDVNIAIAGNQWITKYLTEKILDNGYNVSLIINMDESKSKNISGYESLLPLAEKYNIKIYHPEKYSLKSDIDKEYLLNQKIDILFVFGWQRLIPDWFLDHCAIGAYGVHGGPEKPPRARGRAVFNWAILLGFKKFYMYLFELKPDADSGDILMMTEFDLLPGDDIVSVYHKNCIVSSRMFLDTLPGIINNSIKTKIVQEGEATYLPKRIPEYGGINWSQNAERILNLIRAVTHPYPGAFTMKDEKKLFIYSATLFDTKIKFDSEPGTIIEKFPNGDFIVMTGDYPIYIRSYKNETDFTIQPSIKFNMQSGVPVEDPKI